MTPTLLAWRTLTRPLRRSLGVWLGLTLASAVLTGALLVGDCMRATLAHTDRLRLGTARLAVDAGDHVLRGPLARELAAALSQPVASVLRLRGTVERAGEIKASDTTPNARIPLSTTERLPETLPGVIPGVEVWGVDETFAAVTLAPGWHPPAGSGVWLSPHLAQRLRVRTGDELVLTLPRFHGLPGEGLLSGGEASVTRRLPVAGVVDPRHGANLGLYPTQEPADNLFLHRADLTRMLGLEDVANLLLTSASDVAQARQALRMHWQLADAGLHVRELEIAPGERVYELRSDRVFLDASVEQAARRAFSGMGALPTGVLTYFVNELRTGGTEKSEVENQLSDKKEMIPEPLPGAGAIPEEWATPYSFVAAVDLSAYGLSEASSAPANLPGIWINTWLAEDLGIGVGAEVTLRYWVLEADGRLTEREARFRVRGIVPLEGLTGDRTLLPDYPGLSDVEDCRNWQPGVAVDLQRIRPKDEAYWNAHRGTPKAFIALAEGQKLWSNRFGNLTQIRWPGGERRSVAEWSAVLREHLDPAALGLRVRELEISTGAQVDFGQLFLGLSMFLMFAALLLTGLLMGLRLEDRAREIGTLLALGFTPGQVRRMSGIENLLLAVAGAVLGLPAGAAYTLLLTWAMSTLWRGAVGEVELQFAATPVTLATSAGLSIVLGLVVLRLSLRRLLRRPVRLLLTGARLEIEPRQRPHVVTSGLAGACLLTGLGVAGWARWTGGVAPGTFFLCGVLMLAGWLLLTWGYLARQQYRAALTLGQIALAQAARRPRRSLGIVAMLACGVFLVVAVGAQRSAETSRPDDPASGTGGLALYVRTTMVPRNLLHTAEDRQRAEIGAAWPAETRLWPLRTVRGSDASCLNLSATRQPGILGVPAQEFARRGMFTTTDGRNAAEVWAELAQAPSAAATIPAVGDEGTIIWGLGKNVGDEIVYENARGQPLRLRLVAVLRNNIFQGRLLVDQAALVAHYPSAGATEFVVACPPTAVPVVARDLAEAWAEAGVTMETTAQRLARYQRVERTYLAIFQMLGGLGVALGAAGVGVIVLRNALERRGELALLEAVGFPRRRVGMLVLGEQAYLVALGAGIGALAGLTATYPALAARGAGGALGELALTTALLTLAALLWATGATMWALRGPLRPALRAA